jgi:hypothetical protein
MWRLILQAGKFFLSKEAVPKGATELSKHASKKKTAKKTWNY